jgi:hypothetical protein
VQLAVADPMPVEKKTEVPGWRECGAHGEIVDRLTTRRALTRS